MRFCRSTGKIIAPEPRCLGPGRGAAAKTLCRDVLRRVRCTAALQDGLVPSFSDCRHRIIGCSRNGCFLGTSRARGRYCHGCLSVGRRLGRHVITFSSLGIRRQPAVSVRDGGLIQHRGLRRSVGCRCDCLHRISVCGRHGRSHRHRHETGYHDQRESKTQQSYFLHVAILSRRCEPSYPNSLAQGPGSPTSKFYLSA